MHKKVAILFSPGPFGGAEQVVLKGAKELMRKDTNVKLWLIKEKRNPTACEYFVSRCVLEGIIVKIFECHKRFDIGAIKLIKKTISKEGIEIVHSHGIKANFMNAFLPVKKISTQHGKTSLNIKVKFFELVEDIAIRKADLMVCVSNQMYKNSKCKKKVLIENFLSFDETKYSYNHSKPLKLIFIGRLSPEKGIYDAISTINNLKDVELTVLGDGILRNELQQISSKNIKFLGFQHDIRTWLLKSDALLMPSYTEGLPMTLIEAVATGLPVIASNVGGIPSLVKKNGYLFEPGNTVDMQTKINHFINKKESIDQYAKDFASVIKKQYSIHSWFKKTTKLYKSL